MDSSWVKELICDLLTWFLDRLSANLLT